MTVATGCEAGRRKGHTAHSGREECFRRPAETMRPSVSLGVCGFRRLFAGSFLPSVAAGGTGCACALDYFTSTAIVLPDGYTPRKSSLPELSTGAQNNDETSFLLTLSLLLSAYQSPLLPRETAITVTGTWSFINRDNTCCAMLNTTKQCALHHTF